MPRLKTLLADLLSGDEARAEAAAPALAALGSRALPLLKEAARSENADHRWWAIRAMAELPGTGGGELAFHLKDESAEVRQAAALGLAAHPDESVVPDLIEALHDPDPMTASLAGNALVRNGPAAVPALIEVLNEEGQEARILALRALVELKDPRSIPAMFKMIQEDSAILVHWAQEGLERLGMNMITIKPT